MAASLYGSRVQTPQKQSNISISPTRTSSAFRTTSRNTKANWGNRFLKDTNDLQYDVKYDLIKGKKQLIRQSNQQYADSNSRQNATRNNKRMSGRGSSANFSASRTQSAGMANTMAHDRNSNIFNLIKMNKTVNPQQYTIHQDKKYSTLDSQGLCKHQYEKTIIGKMVHKSNHHMCFGYQTERNRNLNHVWYDPQEQINFGKMMKSIKRNKVNGCHDFGSYTTRRVFEPRAQLDKFYNTDKCKKQTVFNNIKETVGLDKVSGRKEPKLPAGTLLSYNEYEARQSISERPPSYEISKAKRQLQFGRQVISPERGCYR